MAFKKQFVFSNNRGEKLVAVIPENLDPAYGMYVWPSAPVLAQYVWFHKDKFKDKKIIELGAGTALPSVVAAKCNAAVILTDSDHLPQCQDSGRRSFEANNIPSVKVMGLTWGQFSPAFMELGPVDFILGSDCFYDTKDFEDVIVTVSFLLQRNPNARFLCTYQVRNTNWSIEYLLKKWNLCCEEVPLGSFEADSPGLAGSNLPGNHTIQMLVMSRQAQE